MRYLPLVLILCAACGAPTGSGVPADAAVAADGGDVARCPPPPEEYMGILPPWWCEHSPECPPVAGPGGQTLGSGRSRGCVYICPVGWQTCGDGGVCAAPWRMACP